MDSIIAREIKREFDTAARQVVIHIEDDFGHVSRHSVSLTADHCSACGQALPGTQGSADVNASAIALVAHVDGMMPELIDKFESAAKGDPELLKHVQAAKAKREKQSPQ